MRESWQGQENIFAICDCSQVYPVSSDREQVTLFGNRMCNPQENDGLFIFTHKYEKMGG